MTRVALLATGGTIASVSARSDSLVDYDLAGAGAAALLAAVPELRGLADLELVDRPEVSSASITAPWLLDLARQVDGLVRREDVDAVVITHGTDTMEETAWLLALVVPTAKPVVLTGAMRPANALSADGRMNVFAALAVAACPGSAGRGPLVVLNDAIHAARLVRKAHATALHTFAGGEVGAVSGAQVFFTAAPQPPRPVALDLHAIAAFPEVWLLSLYADLPEAVAAAATRSRPPGLVLSCSGAGSVPHGLRPWLERLIEAGTVAVRCSRTLAGIVRPSRLPGLPGYDLTPPKARLALMAGLAAGLEAEALGLLLEGSGSATK